jgi:hypothetical protein
MSSLVHCIYSSRATPGFDEACLPQLLEGARRANAARGISGMLLYVEGNFFQVLEGERAQVDPLYERIRFDRRHARVTQIIHEPIAERDFADWTMGYASLSVQEAAERAGINDFFTSATCLEQLNGGRVKKLLQAFARGRWRAGETGVFRPVSRLG